MMNETEIHAILKHTLDQNNICYNVPEFPFSCVPGYIKQQLGPEVIIFGSQYPLLKHYIALRIIQNQIHLTFIETKFIVPASGYSHLLELCNKLNEKRTTGKFIIVQHPKTQRLGTDPRFLIAMSFSITLAYEAIKHFIQTFFLIMLYKLEEDYKIQASELMIPFLAKMQISLTKIVTSNIGKNLPKEEACRAVKAVLNGIGFRMIREKITIRGIDTFNCFLVAISTEDKSKGNREWSLFPAFIEVGDITIAIKIVFAINSEIYSANDPVIQSKYFQFDNYINHELKRGTFKFKSPENRILMEHTVIYATLNFHEICSVINDTMSYMTHIFGRYSYGLYLIKKGYNEDSIEETGVKYSEIYKIVRRCDRENENITYTGLCIDITNPQTVITRAPDSYVTYDFNANDFELETILINRLLDVKGFEFITISKESAKITYPIWNCYTIEEGLTRLKGERVYKAIEELFVNTAKAGVLFSHLSISQIKVYKHRSVVFAYINQYPYHKLGVLINYSIDLLHEVICRVDKEIQNQAYACIATARKIQPISIDYIPPDSFYPSLTDEDVDFGNVDLAGMKVELIPFKEKDIASFNIHKCLIHPHIISTLGRTSVNNEQYMVLEKHFEFLSVELTMQEKLAVIEQILQAVCFLKLKNVDFKVILPEQLYLTLKKKAKVKVDFNPPGTHEWMFPVQTPGADVYSISLLIYFILIGKAPYEEFKGRMKTEDLLKDVADNHRRPIVPWDFEYTHPDLTQTIRDYWGLQPYTFEQMRETFARLSVS